MTFYRKVYYNSWHTIRANFSLLFFGLFASVLGFHEIKVVLEFSESGPDFLGSVIIFWINLFRALTVVNIGFSNLPSLLSLLGVFIVLAVILILAISSQGALISSAAGKAKARGGLIFNSHWQKGVSKFWPLFGLNVLNTLLGYFFISAAIQPMITYIVTTNVPYMYFFISIIVFFILLPMILIVSFITRYGAAYIVLKDQDMLTAFTNSWNLFKVHWLITIENAIFLTVLTGLYFLGLFTAIIFAFVPFLILAGFITFSFIFFWLVISLGALLAVVIFIAGSALYGAFYNTVWANAFLVLTDKKKTHSKIYRLADKHLPSITK